MFENRIGGYKFEANEPQPVAAGPTIPTGFAVCPLASAAQNPLALQLLAQQQAYQKALLAAREEALRITLSRLQPSVN